MSSVFRFVVCFLLVFAAFRAIAQDEHKLYWSKAKPLKWTDFKAKADTTSKFHASTFCEVFSNYKWAFKSGKYNLTFTTGSYLNTRRSWSVAEKQTSELLRHEQLHFDIAELYARIYLALLNKATYTANFKSEIDHINQENLRNLKIMQDLYDEQTGHSEDKYMQAKWEVYVANLLNNPNAISGKILRGPGK